MKYLTTIIFACAIVYFKWASSQRRIINGRKVTSDKPYMVYLMKHHWSHALYEGWLCGGVIIHPLHILTSATCIKDVYNILVISGLKEYSPKAYSEDNYCTKNTKRRIVSLCEFKSMDYNVTSYYTYNTSSDNGNENATDWARDILGVARMDKPFAFYSDDYNFCDYKPRIISVNLLRKYERPGTQAILLGWGNQRFYRPVDDRTIYNERSLRYTPTVVVNRSYCVEKYSKTNLKFLHEDETLLCTDGQGILNDVGLPFDYDDTCFDCEDDTQTEDARRWYMDNTKSPKTTKNWLTAYGNGACQNDQGGPLVTWIGGRETVIGVISAFMVTTKMECKGPFIFASTACTSEMIQCIISSKLRRSAEYCNKIALRSGIRIYQTFFTWNETQVDEDPNKKGPKRTMNGPATFSGIFGMRDDDYDLPENATKSKISRSNSTTPPATTKSTKKLTTKPSKNSTTKLTKKSNTKTTKNSTTKLTQKSTTKTTKKLTTKSTKKSTVKLTKKSATKTKTPAKTPKPTKSTVSSTPRTQSNRPVTQKNQQDYSMLPWLQNSEILDSPENIDPGQTNNTNVKEYSNEKATNNAEDLGSEFYDMVGGNFRRKNLNVRIQAT